MLNRKAIVAIIGLASSWAIARAQTPLIKPGLWEATTITTRTNSPALADLMRRKGVPPVMPKVEKLHWCKSAADVATPMLHAQQSFGKPGAGCSLIKREDTARSFSSTQSCPGRPGDFPGLKIKLQFNIVIDSQEALHGSLRSTEIVASGPLQGESFIEAKRTERFVSSSCGTLAPGAQVKIQ
jgi:Protein of unknown function (DUF3617)